MMLRTLMTAALLMIPPGLAMAQSGGHQGHAAPAAGDTASTKALKATNDKMHRDMAIRYTGDADRDFVAGMIAHHQGAIEMARVVLQHGRDPEIRKLAEDIIDAQDQEIAQMKAWQAKRR